MVLSRYARGTLVVLSRYHRGMLVVLPGFARQSGGSGIIKTGSARGPCGGPGGVAKRDPLLRDRRWDGSTRTAGED